ncbi:MAG: hypothetical protein ACREIK_05665, partial [Nitrospiraceae bacterium]
VEIRTEDDTTDYCDVAGTLNFDGNGKVTTNSKRRCSATGMATDNPLTLDYTVNPDGSFVITAGPEDLVHGQIVNRGHSLLIDGTTRTDPALLIFHLVAMRRQLPDDD